MKNSILKKLKLLIASFALFLATAPVAEAQTLDCIRRVVWAEARGESKLGQEAVAHVILNRAKKSSGSVCRLVSLRGQFKQGSPPRGYEVNIHGPDPTHGATHFRTRDMPRWLGLRKYIRIGGHTFYGR